MNKAEYTEEEIAQRRDDAIRRALSTPPKPLKDYVGKSERAVEMRDTKTRKSAQAKTKKPEA
jgi:hypothetical protein